MAIALVVAVPFDNYQIGDQITDPATVDKIRASTKARHCRAVETDTQTQPGTPDA